MSKEIVTEEMVPIVDINGTLLRFIRRSGSIEKGQFMVSAGVLFRHVSNGITRYYLAFRHPKKRLWPGCLDFASGIVAVEDCVDECIYDLEATCRIAAVRELEEEFRVTMDLGNEAVKITPTEGYNTVGYIFVVDLPEERSFDLNKSDFTGGGWYTYQEASATNRGFKPDLERFLLNR